MLRDCILLTFILFSISWCYSSPCSIAVQGENWICEGESTVLTADSGFSEYYWSNGQKGQSITVGPGSYRVVARTAEGCVGTAEFFVRELKLPQNFGLSIMGAGRVEGTNWVENRYTFHPYNEHLDYFWLLDGDTIGQGRVLEMDTLPLAAYQLRVTAFSPCTGSATSTHVLLQPRGGTDTSTVYTCSSQPPYYYYNVPFSRPGVYDVIAVNQVGFQVAVRRYLRVEPQVSESYDVVALCGSDPISYFGTTISQPGNYDVPIQSFFGCQELAHLEVLDPYAPPLSLETLVNCGGGWFEHNGQTYASPGLYQRNYPMGNGCDSLAFTFVEYQYELPESEIYVELCPGATYQHDGVSYSEEGIFTRAYTLDNGCDSTAIIHIVHQDTPRGEAHHYFCNGESLELNGRVFTENGSMEYWVPGQGEACDSLFTAFVWELAEMEVEDQGATPDDGSGTGAIEPLLRGGRPPYTYEWSNGATTQNISGLPAGSYTLTVTDDIGCTASFTFDLGLLSGFASNEAVRTLTLGPNPFREELRLFGHSGLPSAGVMLYLYDGTGRLAGSLPISAGGTAIPESLPKGLYWYRLEGKGELLSAGKIVRQ